MATSPNKALLSQLGSQNKQLVVTAQHLHDKEGLTWGEIGGALGMTPQAASRRFGQTTTGRTIGTRNRGSTTGITRARAGGRRGR